ncbi:uncharacterized protein At3g06530 isoform X2 [Medicago truncatula]|uniref:U3 small nucleolar RNA-associated protein n=1 Tax=Medicago truncatula TaxID=3880 RepID=G7K8G8_MEDTR|nr:uncharacterized protein At3g06530 isoform X2 [Medicago truncatula]AET00469.2 U3 small nucleolar RNA-associated protein [Medicago truncatula]
MATSLASQLQAIRSIALTDSAPQKRPFTRPSILFDPKEAADKSTESIYTIAAQGLEVLISTDERFRNYKNSLFSPKSKELDRGLKTEDENKQLNSLINPYLRLISGYFNLPAALQTLEYLIRVYKIHEHNVEDLILCSLPYHDTHAFVRVVQILKIRNRIWEFLKGVKDSGATLPRMVVVQQCLRDGGELLKSLCDYASPSKNPSRNVIGFCTAVVVEVLGVRVDEDIVKIIHPFVNSGLQPDKKDLSDHKASSLMIVCLLGHKTTLAPSLLNGLIRSVAGIARACEEAKDLHWFRLSLIALINLVQSQNVDTLPTKALDVLKKLRDLPGVLLELSKEFNIEKFLVVLLDSLIICSSKDEDCQQALLSLIEKVPINDSVHHVVTKILSTCVKLSEKVGDSTSSMSAGWAKEILKIVDMKYPSELRAAVHHFLQHNTAHSKKDNSLYKILCKMLDGNLDSSSDISKSKVWFGLYHPKADIRRTTLLDINSSGILKNKAFVSEGLIDILEAILRQFDDEDLTVVQAALNVDGVENVPDSSKLLEALQNVLRRCVGKMLSGSTDNVSLTCEVAVSCLKKAISYFHDQKLKSIAAMIYPLLLAMPQTQDLNLKALVLVKEINWQLYDNIAEETTSIPGCLSSINLKVIEKLAGNFMVHHEDNIDWFVKSCNDTKLSKTLFFFVLLQSLVLIKPKGDNDFSALFESVFPILKAEWESSVNAGDVLLDEFNSEVLDLNSDCSAFFDQLLYAKLGPLNAKVMSCIFWRLIKALVSEKSSGNLLDDSKIKDLFVFFALSKFGNAFHEHLHFLAAQFRSAHLLSKFFTDEGVPAVVQVESLQCYGSLCTLQQNECQTDLLAEFPSLLVPLASDDKSVRDASLECIVKLHALWGRIEHGFQFLDELLTALVQIKKLILSDKKILSALFTSSLGSTPGSSYHNILLPPNMQNRFAKKEEILEFILGYTEKFSNYGKLMILSLLKGIGNPIIMHPKIASMLSNLMERYYDKHGNSFQKFSNTETRILCLLLENCVMSSPSGGDDLQNSLLKVLQLDGMTSDNPAYVEPCITVLKKLNSQFYTGLQDKAKEQLCLALVFLCRNANGDVQIATREALMRINIDFKTVGRILDPIIAPKYGKIRSADEKLKKRQKLTTHHEEELDDICRIDNLVDSLSSLLDVLLLKKDIANRHSLLDPLFKLLGMVFSEEWVNYTLSLEEGSSQPPSSLFETVNHIQQTLLIILEDIIMSHDSMAVLNEKMTNEINIKLLIDCARTTDVVVTRNHIFSLLSAVIRVLPEKVFGHLIDILPVIGKSAVTQIDSHSKHVFEDLISAIVPCWLSKTDDVEKLLKVFIDIFPEIVEHRRLSIVLYLLRTLGEGKKCLASLLRLLFSSLVSRNVTYFLNIETPDALTLCTIEWEYKLAVQICEQYASMTWLPSLVSFYEQRGNKNVDQSMFLELFLAMRFCLQKLQDPELLFKLESGVDSVVIQSQLRELMEHVVFLLHLVDARKKELNFPVIMRKELKETMRAVVRNITMVMIPSIYFKCIINLLHHSDKDVGEKALGLLCDAARNHATVSLTSKGNKGSRSRSSSRWLQLDESSQESLDNMCVEICKVLDDDSSSNSLKMAAVSALEVLAERFPSNSSTFVVCLESIITRCNTSQNSAMTSSCLRTSSALIKVLGPKALSKLDQIMAVIKSSKDLEPKANDVSPASNAPHLVSVLVTLEAVVDKLGGFLTKDLKNIMELLVLRPEYVSGIDAKVESRAHGLRKLLAEKIPVRLALPPLIELYPAAVEAGDTSLTILFDMLATFIGTMDRSSIVAFHGRIFDFCLVALDLRGSPHSVQNIDLVEEGVKNAMLALTLKLTESMFKPLFIRSIEWLVDETVSSGSMDRAISFYGMVNKLAENHRSLFVPYFKYLLSSCVHHLGDGGYLKLFSSSQKKKKAKILGDGDVKETDVLSIKGWHLRTLVLSSLHKCFLYDTGSPKFLDSSNFQMLLKPIVSQLDLDPPASLDDHMNIPSVNEFDDLLVVCIGQMAVTAGSDLLWQSLNHEVLMQTRTEKTRVRILGLRIVKYLVDNLKEEYLVLDETIPILGELLEDVELSVKSLAQEILQEMESLSGKSL